MSWYAGSHTNRGGFTLTELLVTMGMIAVLASLLTASIIKAKQKAKAVQCLSNLRQHGLALQSFVADHSVYPLVLNPGAKYGIEADHYSSIWAALSNHGLGPATDDQSGVHVCPSAAIQKVSEYAENRGITGYAYNVHGMGRRIQDEPLGLAGMTKLGSYFVSPVPDSAIKSPSEMIAMGDGVRGWDRTYEDGVGFIARTPDAKEYAGVPRRHNGALMILFTDGHVSGLPLNRLFESRTDEALRLWNRDNQPHLERLN